MSISYKVMKQILKNDDMLIDDFDQDLYKNSISFHVYKSGISSFVNIEIKKIDDRLITFRSLSNPEIEEFLTVEELKALNTFIDTCNQLVRTTYRNYSEVE